MPSHRLTDLFPRPRPIVLQGQSYLALPLRLADLADLEALALESLPGPLDHLPPETEADTNEPGYRRALCMAYEVMQHGLPGWGSPEVHGIVFGTLAGRVAMLAAVLRSGAPDVSELAELAGSLTVAEWNAVDTVALALDPPSELARRIDAAAGVPEALEGLARAKNEAQPPDTAPGWGEIIAEMCLALGRLPSEVAALTISEARALLNRGKQAPVFPENARQPAKELRLRFLVRSV
ncbi:MAG TPA: hypothetical protein VFT74_11725 [Isosphaeraceae bacterium]|nr:hypothetical protein [Isosphaeraceae bacterium]